MYMGINPASGDMVMESGADGAVKKTVGYDGVAETVTGHSTSVVRLAPNPSQVPSSFT